MMRIAVSVVVVLMTLGVTSNILAAVKIQEAIIAVSEFAFAPKSLTLRVGVPTELVIRNTGKVGHELQLYTVPKTAVEDWDDYALANTYFQKMGEVLMEFEGRGHASGNSLFEALVLPGQRAVIRFTPNRAGTFEMACHIPSHYEAGMKGTITFK